MPYILFGENIIHYLHPDSLSTDMTVALGHMPKRRQQGPMRHHFAAKKSFLANEATVQNRQHQYQPACASRHENMAAARLAVGNPCVKHLHLTRKTIPYQTTPCSDQIPN